MSRPVKGQRPYDASRRQEQARQNRLAVLQAARDAFLADGYAATTVASIARTAGVSVETVYKAFGNKPGVLKAVFDVAMVGDDEPVALEQREEIARINATSGGEAKLRLYGEGYVERARRVVPVHLLARDAAVTDAGAAEVHRQLDEERLTGMTHFATHLHESGVLRDGIGVATARDVLWTFTSPELYELVVLRRGWSPGRFGRWLTDQLVAALV